MCPCLPTLNIRYALKDDSVSFRYNGLLIRGFENLYSLIRRDLLLTPKSHGPSMDHVLALSDVLKVPVEIISLYAVNMINLTPARAFSDEGRCYRAVYHNLPEAIGSSFTQTHTPIGSSFIGRSYWELFKHVSWFGSVPISYPSTDTPKGRYFVKRPVWDSTPFFGTIGIHVASLIGDVMGAVRRRIAWPPTILLQGWPA